MSEELIVIERSLPEANRRQAAEIFYEALFSPFLPEDGGIALLARLFDPARAIVARRGPDLLGLAGLNYGGSRLVRWQPRLYLEELGLLRGLFYAAALRLYVRPLREGQLLMDGLAVHTSARGQGIGTRLLDAVGDFAREHGYRSVRLDVVDTNPRARVLYERLGFVPAATHHLPGLRRFIGFSAYTTMIRPV